MSTDHLSAQSQPPTKLGVVENVDAERCLHPECITCFGLGLGACPRCLAILRGLHGGAVSAHGFFLPRHPFSLDDDRRYCIQGVP